jgi:hypothetical protein
MLPHILGQFLLPEIYSVHKIETIIKEQSDSIWGKNYSRKRGVKITPIFMGVIFAPLLRE